MDGVISVGVRAEDSQVHLDQDFAGSGTFAVSEAQIGEAVPAVEDGVAVGGNSDRVLEVVAGGEGATVGNPVSGSRISTAL